jgi:methionine salvage enolase-phosphatase E1
MEVINISNRSLSQYSWFILIDYILVDKNASISETSITGDTIFPESSRRILQSINSNMERTDQGLNLHRISLRMQVPIEENILETLQLRKSVFPTTRPDVQMPESKRLA